MRKKTKRTIVIIAAAVLLIAAAVTIFLVVNANSTGYRSISIAEIFGKVITQNNGKTYEAYKNMRLSDGYALTTDPDSYTRMVLDDDKYVKLEQESHAIFEALGDSKRHLTTIRLEKGALTTEITKPLSETESYVVNTPNAVLAVRGTLFRVEVKQETNGDYYCDVYTYGGSVVSHRIMPDGTHVDEEIVIPAGYKATIKMDEIITVYLEEEIEEKVDNIDPLHISEVNDDDLVTVYNASRHGHEMFLPTEELWNEISDRDIDLSKYKSVYDGTDIPPFTSGDIGNPDSASDNSVENSESSSDSLDITDSSNISDSSEQDSGDSSDDNSSSSTSEPPGESSSAPSGSDDDNTHDVDPESRPPQSSSTTTSVSEPTPVESTPGASDETSSDTSDSSSSSTSSSDNTSSDTPPTPPAHTHTTEETRIEPTCVSDGKVTQRCSVCGDLLSETVIPAKGHTFGEYISNNNATCLKDGTKTALCMDCGERNTITDEGSILPHTPETVVVPSTCVKHGTETVICKVCETIITPETELPLAEHTEVTETVDPTCTENGKTIATCSVCNETLREEIIPATGHSFGEYKSDNNATCQNDGTKTAVCEVCGEKATITDEGSILPHTSETVTVPSTCTEHGSETVICKVCKTIITPEKELPLAEHTEVTENIYPTCTENGKTAVTCSVCNETLRETIIPATGHSFGEYKSDNNATCLKDGTKTAVCEVCGERDTITDKGSILPHTPETVTVPSTCTEHGSETVICKVCETIIAPETELPLAEHTEVTGTVDPTCTEDGKTTVTCSVCGEIIDETVIDALGHDEITETEGNIETVKCSVCGEIIRQTNTVTGVVYPVEVNAENFPDEVFRQYILDNFDTDGDGKLSLEESNAVTSIDVSGLDVDSLEGIDVFAELAEVKHTVHVEDGELDISGIGGIDASKISNVRGGDTSGGTGIISGIAKGSEIGFDYAPGTGKSVSFTLVPDESSTFDEEIPDGIAINAENFPDEKFRTYVSTNFDTDGDGYLSLEECEAVTEIDVKGAKDIISIEGIENFSKLNTLYCYSTPITSLDVSNNTALTGLDCSGTQITSLDVSNNTALKKLWCDITQITSLDVSNNTALEDLGCGYTQISSLDVSNNMALIFLKCCSTQITSLDVGNNTALESLDCNNTQITSLNVSKNTALGYFDCRNTRIPFVDISNNTALTTFTAYGCKYQITVTNGTFDLNSMDGFDISRIVGDVEGMGENGVISGITKGTYITYTYDCKGTGESYFQVMFTLVPDESSTFADATPDGVAINAENFPDEKFREYISTNFDTDSNEYLSQEECEAVTTIDIKGTYLTDGGYTSLKGIEYFVKLESLKCCYNSGITKLDVSKNTALKVLWCRGTSITSLNVDNNTALTELQCNDTQINSLNVSFNTALTRLDCYNTQITSLNVSKNTALETLFCENTQITSLDLSNNTALASLNCESTAITSLDVSNNTILNWLNCSHTQIPFIDISNNTTLYADYNNHFITVVKGEFDTKTIPGFNPDRVTDLAGASWKDDADGILSGITKGTNITYTYDCDGKRGHNATFTLVPDESSTFAPETPKGVAINAENFPDEVFREYVKTNFDKDDNGYLSQEECETVTEIRVNGTSSNDGNITSLEGIKNFNKLEGLYCAYNSGLTELDVSKNTALTDLFCACTQITLLDVSHNTALTYLWCHTMPITSLDVSKNTLLTNLQCCNTRITSLDVSNNTALTGLYCYNTQIASLDVSNNTALTYLECYNTQIASLDVSNNAALKTLKCYNTQLTSLDVSQNTALQTLWCYNCKLPFVDVSANAMLTSLEADLNKYPISTDSLSFNATNDPNFVNFDPNRISNVQGADFNPASGIFDNFTSNTVTYEYNCGNGFIETFTLVRTGEATASLADESETDDDNFTVLPPDDTNTTTPSSSADTGADEILPEDAALSPEDIEGLRFLPLGILALSANRKRKTAFRIKRKAEI